MTVTHDLSALVRRAQERDPSALDALVELYAPRLYGFLRRLVGHRQDAEDLVQEVFVRVVRMLPEYQDDGRFERWLFRIATNLARDRGRRMRRFAESAATGGDGASPVIRMDEAVSESAVDPVERERLQQALNRLPAMEREVLLLRHYTDMGFSEIAELTGTPLGTALARGHRGLARLRKLMEEDASA